MKRYSLTQHVGFEETINVVSGLSLKEVLDTVEFDEQETDLISEMSVDDCHYFDGGDILLVRTE